MKTIVMKFAIVLGVAGGLALGAAAVSSVGANAAPGQSQCIPQYDSSGAQMAPYC